MAGLNGVTGCPLGRCGGQEAPAPIFPTSATHNNPEGAVDVFGDVI
jgi:hypothetical protein